MEEEAVEKFIRRQNENNSGNDFEKSLENLIDTLFFILGSDCI